MDKMKPFIFLNIILSSMFLYGQTDTLSKENLLLVDMVKKEVYKEIIFSDKLKRDKKCHIVTIPNVSLGQEKIPERYYPKLIEKKDSVSLEMLRKRLPDNYWVYGVDNPLVYTNYGEDYINYFDKLNDPYGPDYLQNLECNASFDIIKIYEPFDKWVKLYNSPHDSVKIIIPVKYESLSDGHMFLEKEKYLLYKIELYENGTEVKSMKVIELE